MRMSGEEENECGEMDGKLNGFGAAKMGANNTRKTTQRAGILAKHLPRSSNFPINILFLFSILFFPSFSRKWRGLKKTRINGWKWKPWGFVGIFWPEGKKFRELKIIF